MNLVKRNELTCPKSETLGLTPCGSNRSSFHQVYLCYSLTNVIFHFSYSQLSIFKIILLIPHDYFIGLGEKN